MKMAVVFCVAVVFAFAVPTFAAATPQVYTFSFMSAGNDHGLPSFSFSETFPDFVTSDGPLSITPVAIPFGFVFTQAETCTEDDLAGFTFATANIPFDSGCADGPLVGFGLEGGFALTAYPTMDGVYTAASTEFLGEGIGGGILGLGSATITITPAVPEPASWILFSSAALTGGVFCKNRKIRRTRACGDRTTGGAAHD